MSTATRRFTDGAPTLSPLGAPSHWENEPGINLAVQHTARSVCRVGGDVSNSILSDSALMAALGREMTRAVQRQAVAAGNLANAETPGYRAQEVQFADALDGQLNGQAAVLQPMATHHLHLGGAEGQGVLREVDGLAARRDGNTVQMERELLALSRSGTDFASAQTVLAAKFRLVRYAINEGR